MIQHVYEACRAAADVSRVIVATDDERIAQACKAFGGEAELTSPHHASGTDRVAEVASRHSEFEGVLNVQGDEPGIEPAAVQAVAELLKHPEVVIASAVTPFAGDEDVNDPHAVKVVVDVHGDALYFSRAVIPYYRDSAATAKRYFRHVGIYGFRRDVLLKLAQVPPSNLERAERCRVAPAALTRRMI
jgi:3-deoxy-manno-octulosonate cytidylyltransferase (CMP-KDO synthetase)